jgi:uncharacterized membrane protein HdeD (DUF308 family)
MSGEYALKVERRRTGWDIALGVLLTVAGLVVLSQPAFATRVSIFFIGWVTLVVGVVVLGAGLLKIKQGGFWPALFAGTLLTVLGIGILANTTAAAVTLTVLAAVVFLFGGILRMVVAFAVEEYRPVLIISGIASIVLALLVFGNLLAASTSLLGILLGIEMLIDGITFLLFGRQRVELRTPSGTTTI